MDNNSYLIDKCLHPRKIRDSRGGYMYVPCGQCVACLHKFQARWRDRLDLESKSAASSLFITLTYDNEHIPLATYHFDDDRITTNRPELAVINASDYRSIFNNLHPLDFPQLQLNPKKYGISRSHDSFGFCSQSDVQKFLKRLRRHLDYDRHGLLVGVSKEARQFRYFICSEYGPKTFRPHYHGLLWFSDSRTADAVLECYLRESWQLCNPRNVDCQQVVSNASSYVSKYITANTSLPAVLKLPDFHSFFLRSSRPAIGGGFFSYDFFLRAVEHRDVQYYKDVPQQDGSTKLFPCAIPSCCINRFFPPIYKESSYDFDETVRFYAHSFEFLNKHFPELHKLDEVNYATLSDVLPRLSGSVNLVLDCRHSLDVLAKLSDVYDSLSDLQIMYGIPQNRTAIIRYLLLYFNHKVLPYDYVVTRRHLQTYKFVNNYSMFVNTFNSLASENDLFDVLYWSYPSLFAELPNHALWLNTAEYASLDLLFNQIGYDVEDFYPHTQLMKLPDKFNKTSYSRSYVDDIYNKNVKFDKIRHINHIHSAGSDSICVL